MKAILLVAAVLLHLPAAKATDYTAPFQAEHSIEVVSDDGDSATTYRINQVVPPRQHGKLKAYKTEFTLVVEPNKLGLRTIQIHMGYLYRRSNLMKTFALEQHILNSRAPLKIRLFESDVSIQDDNKKIGIVSPPGERAISYIISEDKLQISTQNREFESVADFAESFPVSAEAELHYYNLEKVKSNYLRFIQ